MPGLLGKLALKRNRAVWDFTTDQLYFLGPGDYDLLRALPPGTDTFQLETAPFWTECASLLRVLPGEHQH